MIITAMMRTGNEPAPSAPCLPCAAATQRTALGDAQPFHLTTGVIGVVAVIGLTLAIFGFSRKSKRS